MIMLFPKEFSVENYLYLIANRKMLKIAVSAHEPCCTNEISHFLCKADKANAAFESTYPNFTTDLY